MNDDKQISPAEGWLVGGGEMGRVVRAKDWSRSPLGPIESWPQSLRTTVSLALASNFPIAIAWGPQRCQIYNDGYWPICAAKHPHAMGQDFKECWYSAWPVIGEAFERACAGETCFLVNQRMFLDRLGYLEETFFTFSFSPIRDETGGVGGLFHPVTELTQQSLAERRLGVLRDIADRSASAESVEGALALIVETLRASRLDVPFALVYRFEADAGTARLLGHAGLEEASILAPDSVPIAMDREWPWPFARALGPEGVVVMDDLGQRFGAFACGPYEEPPRAAVVQPIVLPGLAHPFGFLLTGVSSRRPLDEPYRTFYAMLGQAVSSALAKAHAYEEERQRAEALAQLDRAKTAFFSNVSHEFRTPLTLMLGPLETLLDRGDAQLPHPVRGELEVVNRNGLRLLRLVNTLLDFSRIEAGRVQASFVPTDLGAFTAELASCFRSATDRAGLRLIVQCESLPEPVYVDRDMWEKIVLNLLSNAFKFTFEGEIAVTLNAAGTVAELRVRDTGIGIPAEAQARLFERFFRVEEARGRTYEGSGIGLALVQELIKLHGGAVRVESMLGRGSEFIVRVPFGTRHLPRERINAESSVASTALGAAPFVEEALRWLPSGKTPMEPEPRAPGYDEAGAGQASGPLPANGPTQRPRILVADDNADMREYIGRLLSGRYQVTGVVDGEAAWAAIRLNKPDVILTDVMMPRLDGLGLLRRVREDPTTASVPVILLSARAGEEARVEGMNLGADDYLTKPFGARELLARVDAHVRIASTREEARRLLEQQANELQHANRVKDEFLAMLGHELRNPLSPIVTALQVLRLRGIQSHEQAVIERQVGHLERLVDDLLDVSRITRGTIELRKAPMELAQAVTGAIEIASPLLEQRRQHLELDVPVRGLPLLADEERIAQIVSNLLTNAAKYSAPESRIHLRAWRDGDRILLSVRDEGIGIEPENLERIFTPFVQESQHTDRSRGGLGLGLAIVRNLTEMHDGSIHVHSAGAGQGSEFTIVLPAAELPEAPEPAPARPTSAAATLAGKRVLVVDDNMDAAVLLQEGLEQLGFVVAVAEDGPEALRIVEKFEPDVAILDIGLPVMDGYELAQRLRAKHREPTNLRLVALSGYGQRGDVIRSAAAGFECHLVKPTTLDALVRAIGR